MKSKDMLRLLKITRPTLTKYIKDGWITGTKNKNGFYDYDDDSVYNFLNKDGKRINVIYSRVSTPKQKPDLENQEQNLLEYTAKAGIQIEKSYKDISSGMNYDRKEFIQLMEDVMSHKIANIYVMYKDRFGRTAFDTIEKLFNSYGTKIIIVSDIGITKSTESEFLEEIMTRILLKYVKMY
jgi:putative resolvase